MRKMVILRGAPGSGKSTLIQRLGLEAYALSADALRELLSAPVMNRQGQFVVNQGLNDSILWPRFHEILNARMARGETIAIDTTASLERDFSPLLKLARLHRYDVACLDLSKVPLEQCLAQNLQRQSRRQVPESAIHRFVGQLQGSKVPEGVAVIDGTSPNVARLLESFLEPEVLDLSGASRVVHIGDIQGCATALREAYDRLGGIRKDDFWVFIGDALDRGAENGEVMRFLLEEVLHRPNVAFLWGNHESHIHRWATGQEHVSREFREKTLPQLQRAGLTHEDAERFMERVQDAVVYRHAGQTVFCCHAGLPQMPGKLWWMSTAQLANGTGFFEDNVDLAWEAARGRNGGVIQVHGHRNHADAPTRAADTSFNLEAKVEFGGQLRTATLDRNGWSVMSVKNSVIVPYADRIHRREDIIPRWIAQPDGLGTRFDPELLQQMKAHPGVQVVPSIAYPGVVSINFTKNCFENKLWDTVTVRARGIFVETGTGTVAARGYEKFFNANEREETTLERLRETLAFPLTLWRKENGFLGNTGFHEESQSLLVGSKSRLEGPFAEWAEDILQQSIGDAGMEKMGRLLRDLQASIPMEVIDPVRDPHIVDEAEPRIVLLDVIRRSTNFEKLPYADLQAIGKSLGLEVKEKLGILKDFNAYERWLARVSTDMRNETEGWVIEDANGHQHKKKTPFYDFWKWMRGLRDVAVKEALNSQPHPRLSEQSIRAKADERGLGFLAEDALSFVEWARRQPNVVEALRGTPIPVLRRHFQADIRMEMPNTTSVPGMSL